MNVYVPDELLFRVRAEDIAVSTVCQRALEGDVEARALARSATKNLRAVAERLRRTEDARQAQQYREGYAFGVAWAQEVAGLDELRRVDRAADRDLLVDYGQVPSYVARLMDAAPDGDVVTDDVLDGDASEFDRGVLLGAAEVYRNVRPLVERRPTRGSR